MKKNKKSKLNNLKHFVGKQKESHVKLEPVKDRLAAEKINIKNEIKYFVSGQ